MIADNKPILVADTAFVSPATVARLGLHGVFPQHRGDGAYRETLDDLYLRSRAQARFFDQVLPELVPAFEALVPDARGFLAGLIRPVLVTITSLVVDRSVRLVHRTHQPRYDAAAVAAVGPFGPVEWLADITQAASTSWRLNQDLIGRIGAAIGLPSRPWPPSEKLPEYPPDRPRKNLLFLPQRGIFSEMVSRATNRALGFSAKWPNRSANFLALDLATDRYYFLRRGLLGPRGAFRECPSVAFSPGRRNESLRLHLTRAVKPIVQQRFRELLHEAYPAFQESECAAVGALFAELFVDWFPSGFLEALAENVGRADAAIDWSGLTAIIGPDLVSTRAYFIGTAARQHGKTVIDLQHGGTYGYIEDHSLAGQTEYAFCDKLVTWGWTSVDAHFPPCETVPLPAPKLSEAPLRANASFRRKKARNDETDVLFVSNVFHRFPHISTCGQSRVDFIDEVTESHQSLVKTLVEGEISILHKPYSPRVVRLYPEHFQRLQEIGRDKYQLLDDEGKGLSARLLRRSRLVLWDQIGSGTLECLACKVPTMIFWQRIYSREAPWSASAIERLEKTAVLHSDPSSLASEIQTYLANPHGWMRNAERRAAIHGFCQQFARCDSQWHDVWRRQLAAWASENDAEGHHIAI